MLYRFGIFEVDAATGELRRQGLRVKLNTQPLQLLLMLLDRPGELVTREEIERALWPDGTFVDFEHGVNSAVNRIREALGDSAANPRFLETLARRGYRFIAPVERVLRDLHDESRACGDGSPAAVSESGADTPEAGTSEKDVSPSAKRGRQARIRILTTPEELPKTSYAVVQTLFILFQLMYLGFYVGALANLAEIAEVALAVAECGVDLPRSHRHGGNSDPRARVCALRGALSCAGFPRDIPQDLAVSLSLRRVVVARAIFAVASHQLRIGAGLDHVAGLLALCATLAGADGRRRRQRRNRLGGVVFIHHSETIAEQSFLSGCSRKIDGASCGTAITKSRSLNTGSADSPARGFPNTANSSQPVDAAKLKL